MDNDQFKAAVAKRVKELRLERGMTQFQLAVDAEIDLTQVRRIEKGSVNTSAFVIYKVAKSLKVEIGDLLPG